MAKAPDYSEYVKPQSEDALAQLARLADDQVKCQMDLDEAEAQVERANAALKQVAEVAIPELMQTLGIETFTTKTGLKITVKEDVRASILKEKKEHALAWLRDNNHGALIKRVLKMTFGMGEDGEAQQALDLLAGYEVDDDAGVHPATLAKFVRETLEVGQEVPEELFSIHKQRVAKIQVAGSKKGR